MGIMEIMEISRLIFEMDTTTVAVKTEPRWEPEDVSRVSMRLVMELNQMKTIHELLSDTVSINTSLWIITITQMEIVIVRHLYYEMRIVMEIYEEMVMIIFSDMVRLCLNQGSSIHNSICIPRSRPFSERFFAGMLSEIRSFPRRFHVI